MTGFYKFDIHIVSIGASRYIYDDNGKHDKYYHVLSEDGHDAHELQTAPAAYRARGPHKGFQISFENI